MADTDLTAYLRVGGTIYFEDSFEDYMHETLCELASLSGRLRFSVHEYGSLQPEIDVLDLTKEDCAEKARDKLKERTEPSTAMEGRILRISTSVSVPDESAEFKTATGDTTLYEGAELEGLRKAWIREAFAKRVYDLVVVTNLARIGSLEVVEGWLTQDGEMHTLDDMSGAYHFREAIDQTAKIGWPELHTLEVAQVWDWALRQEGFVEGFGGGPTGRALNAISHLFGGRDDVATHLFWLMVGIEAIYTKGQGSLQEQVREKSRAFLGEQKTHKKKLGQMYQFRSRFVHGDLDFAGRHTMHDDDAEGRQGQYIHELFESVYLAEAILIATLQRMVAKGWERLRFDYTVVEAD